MAPEFARSHAACRWLLHHLARSGGSRPCMAAILPVCYHAAKCEDLTIRARTGPASLTRQTPDATLPQGSRVAAHPRCIGDGDFAREPVRAAQGMRARCRTLGAAGSYE